MTEKFSNRLIDESSPYLLQHSHNPVNWYPWGEEALKKAKELQLPILVSIGYSACHWCHVMERESFEDEEVAAMMNEHFVNIKIDREERPDLDHIYMDAVQAISGSGGWPLNVFLTPDAKPFYGGTYFPPEKVHNRLSWKEVLFRINDAWNNRREELVQQADQLVNHLSVAGKLFDFREPSSDGSDDNIFSASLCDSIAENLLKAADMKEGGFGAAPKFPQTFSIQYLLAYGHYRQDEKALHHAEFSIQQILNGGIYDHLAGGMARYSTDSKWLAPHFEKMLYDNALLITILADAFQLTGKKVYEEAIHKTIGFFEREMKDPLGGYFAAMDADSEGEEGKFYVWDKKEVDTLLEDHSGIYCKWFDITVEGNWEKKNILHISKEENEFAIQNNLPVNDLKRLINQCNEKLLTERNKRIRPLVDDKIILGWNALFLISLCKAAAALGNDAYKNAAIRLYTFLKEKFSGDGMIRFHTYKNQEAKYPAFLDDYAYFTKACIFLQEITSDQAYLDEANKLTQFVIDHFWNEENGFFYYTHQDQSDIIVRKIEFYDGAIPSGNSIMAENLLYLSVVFEKREWQFKAEKMMAALKEMVVKYPASFSVWASVIFMQQVGMDEIILSGNHIQDLRKEILSAYHPFKVMQSTDKQIDGFPLLKGRNPAEKSKIFLCRKNICMEPVDTFKELKMLWK